MDIRIELPGVKLAVVEADEVQVRGDDPELTKLLDEVCARKQKEFTVESLAEAEPVRAARALFRGWGIDPSKYRPASEALLRRVVQGKGLYRVSNVVDVGNLTSIETGWPLGCYDRARIAEPIVFRHGLAGESYEGIGKKVWDLEGRPVLADPAGPFGSPISDSTRSMITDAARNVVVVIYISERTPDAAVEVAVKRLTERMTALAGAARTEFGICRPRSASESS
jgi:DNA/RNA-binding domain of Phe-tRNA-synthetase-like protein